MADKDGAKVEDANGEFYPATAGVHELQTSSDMKKDSMYGMPSSMETETTVRAPTIDVSYKYTLLSTRCIVIDENYRCLVSDDTYLAFQFSGVLF